MRTLRRPPPVPWKRESFGSIFRSSMQNQRRIQAATRAMTNNTVEDKQTNNKTKPTLCDTHLKFVSDGRPSPLLASPQNMNSAVTREVAPTLKRKRGSARTTRRSFSFKNLHWIARMAVYKNNPCHDLLDLFFRPYDGIVEVHLAEQMQALNSESYILRFTHHGNTSRSTPWLCQFTLQASGRPMRTASSRLLQGADMRGIRSNLHCLGVCLSKFLSVCDLCYN